MLSNKEMDPMLSETAAKYIDGVVRNEVYRLKQLLKDIQNDYDNPSCDYLLRHCRHVNDLEEYLKDYSHMFIVENMKVTRYSEDLESGQETADSYFGEELKKYYEPINFMKFRKHVDGAPDEIRNFIEKFYPGSEFKNYLVLRPCLFFTRLPEGTVYLIERESVEYFKKVLNRGDGIHFTKLRGCIGQAPEHIQKYINKVYPGNDVRWFLENNSDAFRVNPNGSVHLLR